MRAAVVIVVVCVTAGLLSTLHLRERSGSLGTTLTPAPGPVVDGLQIIARLDPADGAVRFDIRNASDAPIDYVDYFVGYWEALTLEARAAGSATWTALPRGLLGVGYHKSAGPSDSSYRTVAPGAQLVGDLWIVHALVGFGTEGDVDGALPGARSDLPDEAFGVRLTEFAWPASLLDEDVVEVRVAQRFPDWGDSGRPNGWTGVLRSAVLRLVMRDVSEALLNRMRTGP